MRWLLKRAPAGGRALGVVAALASASAVAVGGAAGSTPSFQPVDLGSLGGGASQALALNDVGVVVGSSWTAGDVSHAFRWTAADGMIDLGSLGGASRANAISNTGRIVGESTTASGEVHAFSWTAHTGLVDISAPAGATGRAYAVNDAGHVAGVGYETHDGITAFYAFVWSEETGWRNIGALSPGANSAATDVNAAGVVVGSSGTAQFRPHGFVWSQVDGMRDLGDLGGASSVANAINDAGLVVGYSMTAENAVHAITWTEHDGLVDIGTLGGTYASAVAVSERGQVVGSSTTASGESHAFSWTAADGMVDLGTLGGSRSEARDVNDAGQVIGYSTTESGERHAFAWTATEGMIDLGTLGGSFADAMAVDAEGRVAGYSATASGPVTATLWRRADTTPPTLIVPAVVTAAATGPDGAVVAYDVQATDDVDPYPAVTCVPPSPGTFAIGDTTVTCTATDAAGNVATARFVVHVRGAAEQLVALAEMPSANALPSLQAKLRLAAAALQEGRTMLACVALATYAAEVRALPERLVPGVHAAALEEAADRIRAVLDH